MRYRRIVTILVSAAVAATLVPVSIWLADPGEPTRLDLSAASFHGPAVPDLSARTDPAEDRLLAQARQQVEAEREAAAAAARQARLERLTRQRTSRDAAQQRLLQAPAPTPAPTSAPAPSPTADDVWARLRQCESGGNYAINTGNGYYGAYQFALATWRSLGFPGYPHEAPPEVQDEAARQLQARSGWGQWPACSRRIGVR